MTPLARFLAWLTSGASAAAERAPETPQPAAPVTAGQGVVVPVLLPHEGRADRAAFFAAIRPLFGGRLSQSQVDGLTRILDYADEDPGRYGRDPRKLAYMLATTFHETGAAMVPVREGGGEAYLRSKPYYPWVGEGLVQVTWERNARLFGATKPGDCMSWPVSLRALFEGSMKGMFTGKALGHYFNATGEDPVGARRVINGTDKAALIAGHYRVFLKALAA